MGNTVPGKVVKALGKLARKPEDVGRDATAHVNMRPTADGKATVLEVCDGRAYVRVEVPEPCDEAVLIDRDMTQRLLPKDELLVDGNEILRPWRTTLERSDGSTPGRIVFPDCEPHRPESDLRVAFTINPKRLAAVCTAIAAVGVTSVEVLLPKRRGGPIGFRGETKTGRGVEGIIVAESLFGATQEDVPEAPLDRGNQLGGDAPKALPGPQALPEPPQDDAVGLPFTAEFVCANDAIVLWYLADGATRAACETHRNDLTPEPGQLERFEMLQPGTAKCEHRGPAMTGAKGAAA